MTTATMTMKTRKMGATSRPRRSLEELVDRLMNTLTFVETPPPAPVSPMEAQVGDAPASRRLSLEEHVDRLMNALNFVEAPSATPGDNHRIEATPQTQRPTVASAIHEARRLRQSGDLDGALTTLAGADTAPAESRLARWLYTEWKHLVKRKHGDAGVLVYSQGMGRAAALVPGANGVLEVLSALGMKWRPGKLVSRRSLRGLRPLAAGGASC